MERPVRGVKGTQGHPGECTTKIYVVVTNAVAVGLLTVMPP